MRFRHKRGFGVHSPFMFNLILNVIRDKGKQFAYPESLEKEGKLGHREKKVFRLLSRLIRYLDVRRVACYGVEASRMGDYLRTTAKETDINVNNADMQEDADFIYIGRNFRQYVPLEKLGSVVSGNPSARRCIMIVDIYKNPAAGKLWRQLGEKANVRVDMMWYGILFFDQKLQKGRYNLII